MSEKDWDAYVAGALASSRRIRAQVEAEYVQYMTDRLAAVTAERDALLAIKEAAQNLVDVKGRHNTAIAYERLAMALRGKAAS